MYNKPDQMNQITPAVTPNSALEARIEAMCKAGVTAGTVLDAAQFMRLEHEFIPGAYARSLWRPAGTLIVGKRHRHPCFTFLLSGHLTIWEFGGIRELVAPAFFVSPAGSKKITFARMDSQLVTVHATNETDLDRLETELIIPEALVEVLPEGEILARLKGEMV